MMYLLMIRDTYQFPETGNQRDLIDYFERPIDISSSMLDGCPASKFKLQRSSRTPARPPPQATPCLLSIMVQVRHIATVAWALVRPSSLF